MHILFIIQSNEHKFVFNAFEETLIYKSSFC